jgi:hypothetical protein
MRTATNGETAFPEDSFDFIRMFENEIGNQSDWRKIKTSAEHY